MSLEVVVALVLGAIVGGLAVWAHRESPVPVPVVPPQPETSPSVQLQQLSAPLTAAGEASAHPRDLTDDASFKEAVAILQSDRVPLQLVTDYVGGGNWMLSTAACCALSARADREQALPAVMAVFPHLRPWTIYYALRYFTTLSTPPPPGDLALRSDEWWAEHPFTPGLLAEHFAARTLAGEAPTFSDLSKATPLELTRAEMLLRKIEHDAARSLIDQLTTFRRSRLDREFLQSFGRFVEADADRSLVVEHDALKEQLAQAEAGILQQPHRSLLVVGEPRSGKSSFLTLVQLRAEAQGWTVFEAGGAHLQAGQEYIGQLEERLRRLATELAAEKRVLWHSPDFLQLALSGTHKGQSASILDQVLPAIASGRLVLLSEITPEALTRVLQQRPALRSALELVRLPPLSEQDVDRLARHVADRIATHVGVAVDGEVLERTAYLARHYLGASQAPGPVLDLLKLAARRAAAHDARVLRREDVLDTMSQLTGMPQRVLDDRERVDLASLHEYFSQRVIGQDEAVGAVIDRIAMLKAGLTDSSRPVGVFLFAGPTGTGKTELAKTLAEFLFGSAERLIRLDMSEFQTVESLRKIIGDADKPDEAQALTHRVRKQPFSVVLLDEFEKAHPNAWDLFLQVFDDGRLTDALGHTVDFRHCIVILTSNVGSTIKEEPPPGFQQEPAGLTAEQVRRAINKNFRPEFINRLDRILVFRPLTREHMRSIVTKELARVLDRRGLRHRDWAVEWEASALEFLLDKGFSPAMGARPLKRAVDQYLLAPLAATLVEHRFPEGDQFLFVRSDGRSLQVEFVDPDAPDVEPAEAAPASGTAPGATLAGMMLHPTGAPAERQALIEAQQRIEAALISERWSALEAQLAARMQRPDFWSCDDRQAVLSRFEVIDRVKAAAKTAHGLAARLERSRNTSGRYSRDLVARLAAQLFTVRHGVDDVLADAPVEIALAVQPVLDRGAGGAAASRWASRLLEMYRSWAGKRGMRCAEIPSASGADRVLVMSGLGVARLLDDEAGLHVLDYEEENESGRAVARVFVKPTPMTLPESAAERYTLLSAELESTTVPAGIVRRYSLDSSPVIRDLKRGWRTGRTDVVFEGDFDLIAEAGPA